MLENLIVKDFPFLQATDTIATAREAFESNQTIYLPVLELGQYLGFLELKNLLYFDIDSQETISPSWYNRNNISVSMNTHPIEVLRQLGLYQLPSIPVLDNGIEYVGVVTKQSLTDYLLKIANINSQGGVICLEIEPRNYSLSQISRICENEQVQILSVLSEPDIENEKLIIILKTNTVYLSAAVQAFERYDYNVIYVLGDAALDDELDNRYKMLMNFINM